MKFDKRTLAALAIVFIIFYFYPRYQQWVMPTQPVSDTPAETVQHDAPVPEAAAPEAQPAQIAAGVQNTTVAAVGVQPAETLTVETDNYRMLVSSLGMTVMSMQFKNYLNDAGEPVEIIPDGARSTLDIGFTSSAQRKEYVFEDKIYKLNKNNILLNKSINKETISATVTVDGVTVTKRYTFYNDKYYFDINVLLDAPAALDVKEYALTWLPGLAPTESDVKKELAAFNTRYIKEAEKIQKKKFNGKTEIDRGRIEYLATKTKYFVLALIPTSLLGSDKERAIEIKEQEVKDSLKTVSLKLKVPYRPGTEDEFRIYLGPQDYSMLTDVGIGLERIMDMGWPVIRNIAVFMLKFIVKLHDFVPNYGVVIIIFSIIIKILFYPLTHKSTVAMRNMQKLQPLMAELKVKYKDNPQQLNAETMKLYKEQGVNPLGGCLPMLLQMPVFFALFRVFDTTIELRGAEFMLWLTDLSKSDPTFILPVIMGITMFLQQKLTAAGTGAQTDQQKMMMYMMPVMMVFFFFRLSSGLVLYYSVFNILSIGQQLLINAKEKKNAVAA